MKPADASGGLRAGLAASAAGGALASTSRPVASATGQLPQRWPSSANGLARLGRTSFPFVVVRWVRFDPHPAASVAEL